MVPAKSDSIHGRSMSRFTVSDEGCAGDRLSHRRDVKVHGIAVPVLMLQHAAGLTLDMRG